MASFDALKMDDPLIYMENCPANDFRDDGSLGPDSVVVARSP
jgi:hypothetical protein